MLTNNCVMAHYDPAVPTQLQVDANPVGLGAILTQTQQGVVRPVAYASRTPTIMECRYSKWRICYLVFPYQTLRPENGTL